MTRPMAAICFGEFSFTKLAAASMSPESASTARAGNPMVQIHEERTIAASPERVFDWLQDPANLTVSPVLRKAGWAEGFAGVAVREVTGIGYWLHEQITSLRRATELLLSRRPARSRPRNTRAVRSRALRRATARMSIG